MLQNHACPTVKRFNVASHSSESALVTVIAQNYFLRGKTAATTKSSLDKYYGESASSFTMMYKWFADFRCGRDIERVHNILLTHLDKLKLLTRWMPRLLTLYQKRERV